MWIITGPFDGEGAAEVSSLKESKLLKAGKSYSLGRKNQPLIISNKKVSGLHCTFTVGKSTLDDAHDPEKRPTLTFHNERDKTMRLIRRESQKTLESKMVLELQDGDVIHIVTGIPISIKWQQICCYSSSLKGKSSVSLETCVQLGISIVYTSNEHITHHILPTYTATPSVASSLISAAQFVKFEWLLEVLKNEALLEETFILPNTSKFRPSFSPSLGPSQKIFKIWEPNEERFNLFAEYRFLVFGEKTREIESDLRDLIKRGGGFIETFDVAGGVAKLHKALTRGRAKENQRLVVIADVKDMQAAIGTDELKKLTDEIGSFGLPITNPETVVQAVVEVDPSLLTALRSSPAATDVLGPASSPNYIPNLISEEPSIPPEEAPARARLVRRAASRQPSTEPTPPVISEEGIKIETPKPRRLLLSRRAKTTEPRASVEPPEQPVDSRGAVAPAPSRIRLKRRHGAASISMPEAAGQSQLPDIPPAVEDEPPLKKFKALFDASDPARSGAVESFDEDLSQDTGANQTQSHLGGLVRSVAAGTDLSAIREVEEEEESNELNNHTRSQMRGTKRKLDSIQQESQDIDIIDVNAIDDDAQPAKKRQALDSTQQVNGIASKLSMHSPEGKKTGGKINSGAPFGKPDTDAAFLTAVASTKKGKRTEDDFDREFNNLRISKPKSVGQALQQREEEEEEWKGFTDFGDDTGLRGNFMVVLEMDVYKKTKSGYVSQGAGGSQGKVLPDKWRDQPNFKKFQKKILPTRRTLIELVVNEDNDVAPTRWKNKKSIKKQVENVSQESKSEDRPPLLRASAQATGIINDSSNNETPPMLGKRKTTPTVQPTRPSSRKAPQDSSMAWTASKLPGFPENSTAPPPMKGKDKQLATALFLDSDDDIVEVDEHEQSQNTITSKEGYNDEDDQTLRSNEPGTKRLNETLPERSRVGYGRRQTAAADDDSDDGATFKGFRTGRTRR